MKAYSLKSRTRQGFLLLPIICITVLKTLTKAIRQEKKIKVIQIGKEVKLSVFADDIILYLEDLRNSMKTSRANK